MSLPSSPLLSDKPGSAEIAEAAAWLARLHGPNRTREVEAGFRRWLTESSTHASAFEMATETWETAGRLRRRPVERLTSWERAGFRVGFGRAALATAAVAALAVLGTIYYLRDGAVVTAVGEQRMLTLDDGSRIYLNTATRVAVRYDENERHVELQSGEALFEVAKRPNWPFVVTAGDRQIRALGTSFVVRRDEQHLAVTLVEGSVSVAPTTSVAIDHATAPRLDLVKVLHAGERLTFGGRESHKLDRPVLDEVTAWQRGKVVLDNTPLADAVAEMNRYSVVKLAIEQSEAADIRISGIFRVGDSVNFAQAIAKTYQLQVINGPRRILLAGIPRTGTAEINRPDE